MASYLLPAPFLALGPLHRFPRLQVAVAPTGDSVRVLDLEPGNPDAAPLVGDMSEWQRKLGLRFDEKTGTIEAVQ